MKSTAFHFFIGIAIKVKNNDDCDTDSDSDLMKRRTRPMEANSKPDGLFKNTRGQGVHANIFLSRSGSESLSVSRS